MNPSPPSAHGPRSEDHTIPSEIQGVLSLVESTAILRAVKRVPPHVWTLFAAELEARVKPSNSARSVRAAFWSEAGIAMALGEGAKVAPIAARAGLTYDHAHDLLTDDPAMLAWLLQPMRSAPPAIEPLLSELLERVSDIVRLPLTDNRGRTSVRNGRLILRAVEVLAPLMETAKK